MIGAAAVSVPGKTILFGEHAAVYGHPALVTALDHRMTVTVTASSPGNGAIHLDMPGCGAARSFAPDEAARIAAYRTAVWARAFADGDGSSFRPVDIPGELAVLATLTSCVGLSAARRDVHVRVESAIPTGSGFGSSAALAVGVTAACHLAFGRSLPVDDIAEAALRIERHQHGSPSGVDVQAVLRGGVLWCRREPLGLAHEEVGAAAGRLGAFRLFHSGSPAESTGEMVAAVRRLRDEDPARVEGAFAAIEAAAREGRAALLSGDDAALVAIVRRAEAALEALDVVHSDVRAAIRAIEAEGGAAKISGAGGRSGAGAGLVLVVHPDPGWHRRFAPPAGWIAHGVGLGAQGLREEIAA